MRARIPIVVCALLAALSLPAAAGARDSTAGDHPSFLVGFADALFSGEQGERWAARTAAGGANAARVNVYWNVVGPHEPENPRDPADPAYDFAAIDRAVRSADSAGLDVLMTVLSAPRWAEGPGRPASFVDAPAGTWRPSPEAYGDFARAIAYRYNGDYPDPLGPGRLPEVDLYSAWNEPNISAYLTPQFEDGENASAETYVGLLNAFADAVRTVNPDATIATGGTAPFGDPDARRRTAPLEFWRGVLCLDESLERDGPCPGARPDFDLLAHHPITYLSSPNVHAANPDDVTVADFGDLVDMVRAADEEGTVAPRSGDEPHGVIAPEVWWETNPPERGGVSFRRQARYTALALHLLWKAGAEGVWFLQVRDAERSPSDGRLTTYQTGVYTFAGRRKPALRAVQFPFVTTRADPGHVSAWGIAPAGGRLQIRVKPPGGHWRAAASTPVRAGDIFTEAVPLRGKGLVRAVVAGRRSLNWRQRR